MSCCSRVPRLGTCEVLSRIVGWNGAPIVSGDIDTISYSAFILETATGEENAVSGFQDVPIDVDESVEDQLLRSEKWTEDNIGFNFHFIPDGAIFNERNEIYLIRVTMVPVDVTLEELVAVFNIEVH